MSFVYEVYELPHDESSVTALTERFASLRLHILKTMPASWLFSYEKEAAYTSSRWISYLMNPKLHGLICVAHDRDDKQRSLENGEWVGMVILLGPLSKEEFNVPGSGVRSELLSDEEETRWAMMGLATLPAHRGRDTAILWYQRIVDLLRFHTDAHLCIPLYDSKGLPNKRCARLHGCITETNLGIKALYQSVGGYEVGWASKAESLKLLGVPDCETSREENTELLSSKTTLVMEVVIEC